MEEEISYQPQTDNNNNNAIEEEEEDDVVLFPDLDFPHFFSRPDNQSRDDAVSFDRETQVSFVMDLFHQRVDQSGHEFDELGLADLGPSLDLDLDLELGLGFADVDVEIEIDDLGNSNSGFVVADCGDEFSLGRDGGVGSDSGCDGGSDSGGENENYFMGGLRVVDIGSDSEYGFEIDHECEEDEAGLTLCWDAFQLDDDDEEEEEEEENIRNNGDVVVGENANGNGRNVGANEDFEWEEVDDGGIVDEREVLSMFFDAEGDEGAASVLPGIYGEETVGDNEDGVEWQVLSNVHTFGDSNLELEHDLEREHDEYYAEYEMFFGQFVDNENPLVGRPPAAKRVVENLLSVVMTKEDVENENALCAVCKDDVGVGNVAKQLPCSHRYHGDCIVPWLGIRNTCPVCRHELPTDDAEYERRRAERAARAL